MKCPRIRSVEVIGDHILIAAFDNGQKRRYDISPLLEEEAFMPLKNPAFFRAAKVERGGYAVVWSDSIDLSEHELWTRGQAVGA